jgi:hypothetical protein
MYINRGVILTMFATFKCTRVYKQGMYSFKCTRVYNNINVRAARPLWKSQAKLAHYAAQLFGYTHQEPDASPHRGHQRHLAPSKAPEAPPELAKRTGYFCVSPSRTSSSSSRCLGLFQRTSLGRWLCSPPLMPCGMRSIPWSLQRTCRTSWHIFFK